MTDMELDFLTHIDQHLLIEEGIMGGGAMISHQYAWTNTTPGMENYDASKGNSYTMYPAVSGRQQLIWMGHVTTSTHI